MKLNIYQSAVFQSLKQKDVPKHPTLLVEAVTFEVKNEEEFVLNYISAVTRLISSSAK